MKKIQTFDQLCYEIEKLETKDKHNHDMLKEHLKTLYNKSNPLTIITQVITTSFKDVKENSWTKLINLGVYIFKGEIFKNKIEDNKNILDIALDYISEKVKNRNKSEKSDNDN